MITILAGQIVGNIGTVEIYEVDSMEAAASLKADLVLLSDGKSKVIFHNASKSVSETLDTIRAKYPEVRIGMVGV
jgi:hypothetical protein